MKTKITLFWIFILSFSLYSYSQKPVWKDMAGSAFIENSSYSVLQRICDEAGARMMGTVQNTFSPNNYFTIELVWFNGEETGLWGSKKYVEQHKHEPIRAMINLDVVRGLPSGFNTCGFNEFRPLLEDIVERLNGFNLSDGCNGDSWYQ